MDDVLNDALSNLEHDNYECSDEGHENRRADVALIRAALAAQPAASAEPSDEYRRGYEAGKSVADEARAELKACREAFDLATRYGRPAGDAVAADEITYEIWQDDMMVASSNDPKDASHYAAVYSQDGPVKVYTVLRSEWEGPNGGIVRGAGQMPAGDAQPVAIVKENPYCPEGLSDEINEYLPNGTVLYAAPVPAGDAQPVAWVAADTLNSPHPKCVSSLAYVSQIDQDRGREYVPLYAAPVAAQRADGGDDAALRHNWNEHLIEHNALGYQHDFVLFKVVEAYVLKHLADRQQRGGDDDEYQAMLAVMEQIDPATFPGLTATQRGALGRFAKPVAAQRADDDGPTCPICGCPGGRHSGGSTCTDAAIAQQRKEGK